jgi:acetamidase/formamidase
LVRPLNEGRDFVFRLGGHRPKLSVRLGETFTVFTEDCFCGRLTSSDCKPREVAPYPQVNPLTGPIAVEGVQAGDILAIRLLALEPARDWGVATISPNFGLLSGTRASPNLQAEQDERVWIWRFSADRSLLETTADNGAKLTTRYRPFHGTLGVAPPHGEVRLGLVPGDFGGNLDIPDLTAGATLYLRANVDGGHIYIGDGHYAQGDGEIAGTAVEGAFHTTLSVDRAAPDAGLDWPRLETETHIGVIGCARPVDDAVRIAVAGLVRWVASRTGLSVMDAHQLVSQTCRLRIGNLVNPAFSVLCSVAKKDLPVAQ